MKSWLFWILVASEFIYLLLCIRGVCVFVYPACCCCFGFVRIQLSVPSMLSFQVMQRFSLKTVKYYSIIIAWQ